jgi:hypothetical protein
MKFTNEFPDEVPDSYKYEIVEYFDGSSTYAEDYKKARKYAKKVKGMVYTVVNGPGTSVYWRKGAHWVDRLGFVVLARRIK